jgi:hypothetical protein
MGLSSFYNGRYAGAMSRLTKRTGAPISRSARMVLFSIWNWAERESMFEAQQERMQGCGNPTFAQKRGGCGPPGSYILDAEHPAAKAVPQKVYP